jgi:CSLREA domain-containing protein
VIKGDPVKWRSLLVLVGTISLVSAAVVPILGLLPPSPAATAAATFAVDATADGVDDDPGDGLCATSGGSCTLRAAIQESNALAGVDMIELPAGTYVLSVAGSGEDAAASGDLDITDHLTITGAGDEVTVIDAAGLDRVLQILSSTTTVTLKGIDITGGRDPGFAHLNGGGIFNEGVLVIERSTVSENHGGDCCAGAVYSLGGSLEIRDSLIVGNDVYAGVAGVLSVNGPLTVERTTVAENGTIVGGGIRSWDGEALIVDSYIGLNGGNDRGDAGGISNGGCGMTEHCTTGVMTIVGTTIEGNQGRNGGGVENAGGELWIVNSTISGNTADNVGGGVYSESGSVFLVNATIADNTAPVGGGLSKELGAFVEASNTILSGNTAADGPDCYGTIKSLDYNLFGELADCTLTGATTHNLVGVDPLLGPLADNGGPTDTRALLAGSPAIDAGPATCDSPDQRGVTRPQGTACDIGAFEVVPPEPEPEPEPVTFVDDDDSIFEADIEWIAARGITKGCNPPANTMYCPDSFVTRGQMAAFLVRALGYTDDGGGDLFIDDDDSIFEGDIDRLGTAGVTKGCNPPTNNRYCPNARVTRGQMAAFLVRALGYTDNGGGNLFIDDDHSIFEGDIDRLGTAGVTKGCNPPANNRYCPTGFVTRGQMAAFLHRALD